ncbi:hypothetical protein PsorP6_012749 [Peronosclerospora sorghi]|uniref:Uncharacterized protein n=1 Tax=Peronosclerospora sorghi TaxID=230839 RepID=A0ACC0WFI0_9STRA|nr:hypothetical protein PsorP6_012749 [Peronosclerospora sorghi]
MKKKLDLGVNLAVETSRGYHNRHCELCATGKSCYVVIDVHGLITSSPITTPSRKDDEWFCSYCQAFFGGSKPRKVLSDDNKYVLMCLSFPNSLCIPIESMVDTVTKRRDNKLKGNLKKIPTTSRKTSALTFYNSPE